MADWAAAGGALRLFGVTLIGATPENGRKLLLTVTFVLVAVVGGWVLRRIVSHLAGLSHNRRVSFWGRQTVNIALGLLLFVGVLSIWFDDPNRLATALGLVTAGLAFALQRVITALAGYLVILRGRTFNVGDRIVMGGVRGDVVALGFMQTTILEMGQPPPVQSAEPAVWVASRQYTGRVVTVSNAQVFDEPVYNYTRDFPLHLGGAAAPGPVRRRPGGGRADHARGRGAPHGRHRQPGRERRGRAAAVLRRAGRERASARLLATHRQLARDDRPLPRPRPRHARAEGRDEPRDPGPPRRGRRRGRLLDGRACGWADTEARGRAGAPCSPLSVRRRRLLSRERRRA